MGNGHMDLPVNRQTDRTENITFPQRALCMPQIPFAFESEQPNGNLATKQSPNFHLAIQGKLVEWPDGIQLFDQLYPNLTNGNLATALSPNYHLAVQTQTQMHTEPEGFRKHAGTSLDRFSDNQETAKQTTKKGHVLVFLTSNDIAI